MLSDVYIGISGGNFNEKREFYLNCVVLPSLCKNIHHEIGEICQS